MFCVKYDTEIDPVSRRYIRNYMYFNTMQFRHGA